MQAGQEIIVRDSNGAEVKASVVDVKGNKAGVWTAGKLNDRSVKADGAPGYLTEIDKTDIIPDKERTDGRTGETGATPEEVNSDRRTGEAGETPDYKKGADGCRGVENGYGEDILIHRFYGAVEIDDKLYRVKTTIKETQENKIPLAPHSFEVTEIELLPTDNSSEMEPKVSPKYSGAPLRIANLLNGVEKSYEKGVKLLDASQKSDEDGGNHYRDGEEMSDGERLKAIQALTPIPVERNAMSRAELREAYKRLRDVKKDGRKIEFYRSAFKKIYKEGGLFAQVVPVLDDVLEDSVLAYSEKDNLGGTIRPDGTIHKEHPNVDAFDNYVGKILLGGKEYYVRTTVQHSERSTSGTHSFMVTSVDIYEKTADGLSLPITTRARGTNDGISITESRTIPITSRGTTNFDGIVDAKLQQFFERANRELTEEAMVSRVEELSEKFGVPISIIRTEAERDNLPNRRERRKKGSWNETTDKVEIVIPNHADVADVENTVVHEVIGHKGLRAFIGKERFTEFIRSIYSHLEDSLRAIVDAMAERQATRFEENYYERLRRQRVANSQDPAHKDYGRDWRWFEMFDRAEAKAEAYKRRGQFRDDAMEEYMSDLGGRIGDRGFEKMSRQELTLWGTIKAKVQQFLDAFLKKMNISARIRLSDKDLAYILFKSWKHAKEQAGTADPNLKMIDRAEDIAMRHRTGYGQDPLKEMSKREEAEAKADFRRRQQAAVKQKGIVPMGLAEIQFNVVNVKPMKWLGNFVKSYTEIYRPFIKNLPREGYEVTDSQGETVAIRLNAETINKLADPSSYDERISKETGHKRASREVYFAVAGSLKKVLAAAHEIEIHPDMPKDGNLQRGNLEPNSNSLIHRYCSAVIMPGGEKIYRVDFTILENCKVTTHNLLHSQEVLDIDIKVEPSEKSDSSTTGPEGTEHNKQLTTSLDGAKLLKGVEKSYEKGVKLLDASQKK